MMELNPEITKEVDHIFLSLEKSKQEIEKKFKSILEDYISEAWNNFDYYIEGDARYNFDRWIKTTCDKIIEGLLAGDVKWLKQKSVISEYSWDSVKAIRIAILKAHGEEIENCVIKSQQEEIEQLKKDVKFYRGCNARY